MGLSAENNTRRRLEAEAGTTNSILSDLDYFVVRELLSDVKKDLEDVDIEISYTRSAKTLVSLQERRRQYVQRIQRFSVALAPHKRLPPEILSWIFIQCLDKRSISIPHVSHDMPWVLSYVCSRWRSVAINEPRLWNLVELRPGRLWSTADGLEMAKLVMSRSGQSLVSLLSRAYHFSPNSLFDELVLPHKHRLHELTFTYSDIDLLPFLKSPPVFFESLESLNINIESKRASQGGVPILSSSPITVFGIAPRLRKITFRSNRLFILRSRFDLLYANITHIALDMIVLPLTQLLKLLCQCIHLLCCRLSLGGFATADLATGPIHDKVLPSLHALILNGCNEHTFPQLLRSLRLPSLTEFAACTYNVNDLWPREDFLSLLEHSGCRLESFTSTFGKLEDTDDLMLGMMPTLKVLNVSYISPSTLAMISRNELLPVVEEIKCPSISAEEIRNILESSRRNRVSQVVN